MILREVKGEYMKKSNIISIILIVVLVSFVGYYAYQQLNQEEVQPYETKLINYSNEVKELITNSDYSFDSTLIDSEWLDNNLESTISCAEVYYSNTDMVLLHDCEVPSEEGKYYFYNKAYTEQTYEYKKAYEEIKNQEVNIEKGNLLSNIVTIDLELGIEEIDSCSNEGICPTGTEFAIQVNDSTAYRFYVLTDDGEKVELIMDHNLVNHVVWAPSDNGDGPTDTLEQLQQATENWTNIPLRNYRIADDNVDKVYDDIHIKTRATIPSYTKLVGIDPNLPDWLYNNSENGYWLSSASKSMSFYAWIVEDNGTIDTADVSSEDYGIRPVITIYK